MAGAMSAAAATLAAGISEAATHGWAGLAGRGAWTGRAAVGGWGGGGEMHAHGNPALTVAPRDYVFSGHRGGGEARSGHDRFADGGWGRERGHGGDRREYRGGWGGYYGDDGFGFGLGLGGYWNAPYDYYGGPDEYGWAGDWGDQPYGDGGYVGGGPYPDDGYQGPGYDEGGVAYGEPDGAEDYGGGYYTYSRATAEAMTRGAARHTMMVPVPALDEAAGFRGGRRVGRRHHYDARGCGCGVWRQNRETRGYQWSPDGR